MQVGKDPADGTYKNKESFIGRGKGKTFPFLVHQHLPLPPLVILLKPGLIYFMLCGLIFSITFMLVMLL